MKTKLNNSVKKMKHSKKIQKKKSSRFNKKTQKNIKSIKKSFVKKAMKSKNRKNKIMFGGVVDKMYTGVIVTCTKETDGKIICPVIFPADETIVTALPPPPPLVENYDNIVKIIKDMKIDFNDDGYIKIENSDLIKFFTNLVTEIFETFEITEVRKDEVVLSSKKQIKTLINKVKSFSRERVYARLLDFFSIEQKDLIICLEAFDSVDFNNNDEYPKKNKYIPVLKAIINNLKIKYRANIKWTN